MTEMDAARPVLDMTFASNMLSNQLVRFIPQPDGTYSRTYLTMGSSSLHLFTTGGLKLEDIACHSQKFSTCKTLAAIQKKIGSGGVSGAEITVTLTADQFKKLEDHYRGMVAASNEALRPRG